jgi:hypothetical protein
MIESKILVPEAVVSKERIEELKPFEARKIIEHLRKGSVPVEQVDLFSVGREKWLQFIEDDLQNYIAEGGSKVRFINGDYGDGKTHFMSIIRHLALSLDFAVSFVVLTRDVPIHKFEVVYQSIVQQLTGKFPGTGIRHLLEFWADQLKADIVTESTAAEGSSISLQSKLTALAERLRLLPGMNLNFVNGLTAFLSLRYSPLGVDETEEERQQSLEIIYQWFEGGKVAKKDLKPFQIFEALSKTNSKSFLCSLVAWLKYLGHKGLILLMDELETVIAHPTSVRNAAYENVRLLIDNTEQADSLHIFFSIIPDVLLAEKGFKSYDALWSRVRSIGDSKRLNYRGVLIDLHRTPLEVKELVELGVILRQIHEQAYRWQAGDMIKDDLIEKLCQTQQKMGVLNEVRLFIKQFIRYLDMAEQGDAPEEQGIAEQITSSQREMEQEKLEQLQPSWDN